MPAPVRWLAALPRVAVTVLMLVATVDMLVGVFLRYVWTWASVTFDLPRIDFFWVEEVGELSLTWLTFIGAAIGIRHGIHFSIHLLIDRFPPGVRRTVLAIHYLLVAGFGVVIAVFGWEVAELNSLSLSPGLSINLWWLYFSAVVGGVLIALYGLATVVDVWRGAVPGAMTTTDEHA